MYPWKAEASCDISKCKKYYFPQVADPPFINSAKKVHFGMAEVNISYKFSGSKFITTSCRLPLVVTSKNNLGVLPRFDQYSLSGVTTPQQEMKDSEFHRKQMTVFIFFIHGLCNCLRIHFKRCLIPFLDDERLHIWSLLKVYVRGAAVGKNPTDMLNALLINVWQDIVDDLRDVSRFSNIFAFDILYQHPWMQWVMDNCSSGHLDMGWLNFLLVCITNPWLS